MLRPLCWQRILSVSYTHLDVYKRQVIISGDKFAHRILRYLIKYRKQIWIDVYKRQGVTVTSLNDIPSDQVESSDLLKDASSTATYSARGANGVILVTTKGAK